MDEQEIKDSVELIVKLESQADELAERDNFSQSSAATEAAGMLEKELEEQGYFLGESGADMLVYRASPFWLIFNRSNGQWRYSSEASS